MDYMARPTDAHTHTHTDTHTHKHISNYFITVSIWIRVSLSV